MQLGALDSSLRKSLPETLAFYSDIGLQGIQLRIRKEFFDYSESQITALRKSCEEKGLCVCAFCGDLGGHPFQIQKECMERAELLCRMIEIAKILGTSIVTTHLGVIPEDRNDPSRSQMVRSVGYAAQFAERHGACIAVETGPELPEILLDFILEIGSDGLKVNLDPANFVMLTRTDPVHAVEILGDFIVHTHAKDGINLSPGNPASYYGIYNPDGSKREFPGDVVEFQETPLGSGRVPWKEYFNALERCGYDGFLTIERECGEHPEKDIETASRFLKQQLSMRKTWKRN